jgi:site-specific DNA-methyltransferase (adenine-specific)
MTPSRPTSKNRAAALPALETQTRHLDAIVPYWRNPRVIPEEAVQAVAESIRRYGYTQPIVIDAENVIVIGHTRYAALRRLGVDEVPVVVCELSPAKIKQLRVLDNRTHEYTSWNIDALSAELDDLDAQVMMAYFPEVGEVDSDGPDATTADLTERPWERPPDLSAEFTCPSCFHSFSIDVTKEAVMSGTLEVGA